MTHTTVSFFYLGIIVGLTLSTVFNPLSIMIGAGLLCIVHHILLPRSATEYEDDND